MPAQIHACKIAGSRKNICMRQLMHHTQHNLDTVLLQNFNSNINNNKMQFVDIEHFEDVKN